MPPTVVMRPTAEPIAPSIPGSLLRKPVNPPIGPCRPSDRLANGANRGLNSATRATRRPSIRCRTRRLAPPPYAAIASSAARHFTRAHRRLGRCLARSRPFRLGDPGGFVHGIARFLLGVLARLHVILVIRLCAREALGVDLLFQVGALLERRFFSSAVAVALSQNLVLRIQARPASAAGWRWPGPPSRPRATLRELLQISRCWPCSLRRSLASHSRWPRRVSAWSSRRSR
jgi:hypothetical protein